MTTLRNARSGSVPIDYGTIATGTVLTGTLTAVGSAIRTFGAAQVTIDMLYTRNAGSVTGTPIIRLEGSRDVVTTDPNAVGNWRPVAVVNGAVFTVTTTGGQIAAYPEEVNNLPTSAAQVARAFPFPTAEFLWFRVLAADSDLVNFGTLNTLHATGVFS